ncbi:hypothetical protein [Variovorax sp. UC122_21]|uniref:hypothetical protein n=1 Tax=Variovorax sp. UC122_21 TaxID=3374554 RepID=UPI003756E9DF
MPSLDRSSAPAKLLRRATVVLRRLAFEADMLLGTLLSPNKVIAEVEQMRALQRRADRIEATDPARAAALRWHASRVGLR